MEYMNGKPSSVLSDAVDYSRILHNGVPQDELESLLREHDRAKEAEISSLRLKVSELASRSGGAVPASTSEDRTEDVRSEVSLLRQELATAMTSFRSLLSGADGNLHEMQLASLRRQVSQLEGVLESNYQRELRVAEERESSLRAEMAQMRQDLRVALETLYRMPDEEATSSASVDLKPLEEQITELGTAFFRLTNEQQAHALEREGTLKAELAHMRRDLLVTLEASYQLPTERVEALDAQIASWRGQVEELQQVVLGLQDAQEGAAAQQRSALQAEMNQLRQEIQTALASSLPPSEHEELAAQGTMVNGLMDRLDQQASEVGSHFEQLADLVSGRSSTLEEEFETLRADLQTLARAVGDNRVLDLLGEREQSLSQDIASLRRDLVALAEAVAASDREPVDDTMELLALRDSVTALGADLTLLREEQQSLLHAHNETLHEELAASQASVLEAASAIRESRVNGPVLTVEAIGEMIGTRMGEVQAHWSEAQTDLYRQLVSQIAEVQADLDLVNTAMLTAQPIENDDSEVESALLERVNQILDRQQQQSDAGGESVSAEDLKQLRNEIQAIRVDLQASLQAHSPESGGTTVSAPDFSLDDVVREISARLETQSAEADRISTNRDAALQQEFEQIRQEVLSAVQQIRATVADGETTDSALDLTALHNDIAEIRESVSGNAGPHDSEVRAELATLRQDLRSALDEWQIRSVTQQSDDTIAVNALADRMTELESALHASRQEQQRGMEERDEKLYAQLGDLSANFSSAPADEGDAKNSAVNDAWRAELTELRGEIAALAQRTATPEVHDDSAIIELVSAVRNEMRDALDAIRTSDTTPSDQPAIRDGLTALAISIQQATAIQDRSIEAQQQTLQAAIAQMRDELHNAVSSLTRESVDSFEKRQSQLRIDQLEMERNLAQLRQELVATQSDPANKKKLWR